MFIKKIGVYIISSLFSLLTVIAYGQKRQVVLLDSIQYALKGNMSIKEMEKCSNFLLESYYLNPKNPANLQYAQTLVRLAREKKDPQYGVYAYSVAMFIEENPKRIAITADSCLWCIENTDNKLARFKGYLRLGDYNGHDTNALNFFLKALEEMKYKQFYAQETDIYATISKFYSYKNDYSQAIKYQEMALRSAELSKDVVIIREALNDLGVMYYEKDTLSTAMAEQYYNKALATFKDDREKSKYTVYPKLLINVSTIYQRKRMYEKALDYLNEAFVFALEEDDHELLIQCYTNMGFVYQRKKEFGLSESFFIKAIDLLPKLASNLGTDSDSNLYYTLYGYLADTYYKMGKYDKAVEYYDKARESFQAQYKAAEMYESRRLEDSYKREEEENRISKLNQQVRYERIQKYFSIAIILLSGIGIFFGYKFFREKLKISKQKEAVLRSDAELLKAAREKSETNSKLLEEKAAHQEYQRKLNLYESERLSRELGEKELLIRHRNNVLEEAEQRFLSDRVLKSYKNIIQRFIMQEKRIDHSFEEAEIINQSEFYKKLQEESGNNLTPLDLKYCNCIAQRISSKEIANLLSVELQTVRVSKYRLKQKLGLGKEDDLNEFIEELYTKYNMA